MKKTVSKFLPGIILLACMISMPMQLRASNITDCAESKANAINSAAHTYKDAIERAAHRYDVRPELIKAVIAGRSCFDPVKVSAKGELGLMQLMPATTLRFGATDITDPAAQIDAGTRYLSYLQKRYAGDIATVLAAYSADEGWEGNAETIHSSIKDVREPVSKTLDILLKLDKRKKANRQAKKQLKTWGKAPKAYQQALLSSPQTRAHTAFVTWYQSRLEKVHYPRTPEARSCGGFSAKTLARKAAPYEHHISKAAKRHGVSPALIKSVIAAESCYREMVVSPKGAGGLMQLMPETAAELGVMDMFDPEENINAGTRYLGWLIHYYGGSYTHAIAAYNAGPGRITRNMPVTIEFTETRGYINTVLTHLTNLESGKKAREKARTLLADWHQTELEYQAALRGETPLVDVAETAQGVAPDPATTMLPTALAQTAQQQPEVIQATYRTLKPASATNTQPEPEASVSAHLIPSVISDDVVRIKRISTSVTTLSPDPQAVQPDATPSQPEPVPTAAQALQNCNALPLTLTSQTQQKGSGRYAAFFYRIQDGETLETIARKLGANIQDIMQLGNMSPDTQPRPGTLIRVAECSKTPA